ncbi:MAG TPA: ligase-associated DNA damage response endonuclease PdeM [Verrucomicrobiae bacterium]|nr:ligase-associated DNA damage response endonuclease PdeM [Verrucomicrobiae bacterium]
MIEINCAGEQLRLLPEKAVAWPAARSLIIADLHLGKPAAFRAAGIAVPETTTDADLERLDALLRAHDSRRLIVLGDLLHAPEGMQQAMISTVNQWRANRADLEIILVPGNHDRKCGSPPVSWNMRCVDGEWQCGPFLFSHEPVERAGAYVIAGHVHPALVLREKFGPGVRAACFCFGKSRAILPAFGSFTGMSNLQPAKGDRIFAIGSEEVIEIK